jgi:putative membrane protein insertion efficiency factor
MQKSLKMNNFNDRPKVFSLEQLNHIIYFESSDDRAESILKKIMLDSIRWYRETLSPIMPPNCRFFPSCSNYALQAIEEFGPIKGGILTGWRIFRCNPFGNIIYI